MRVLAPASLIENDAAKAPWNEPGWFILEEGFAAIREREIESLMTVGNGYLGTRGSVEETTTASEPGTFFAGLYDPLESTGLQSLIVAPDWLCLQLTIDGDSISLEKGTNLIHRRILDMKRGMMYREWRFQDEKGRITQIKTTRFCSLANHHLMGQRVQVLSENYSGHVQLQVGLNARSRPERQDMALDLVVQESTQEPLQAEAKQQHGIIQITRSVHSRILIAMASGSFLMPPDPRNPDPVYKGYQTPQHSVQFGEGEISESWEWETGKWTLFDVGRFVSAYTSRDPELTQEFDALKTDDNEEQGEHNRVQKIREITENALYQNLDTGYYDNLAAHTRQWKQRWKASDIKIEGDFDAQVSTRFSLYHLNILGAPWDNRVSIGARALSGSTYEGHVFWDTEIFILPFFIYTWPEAARAMLMYRYNTLGQARLNAKELGNKGAYYPWESATDGTEQTIPYMRLPDGQIIPILSGVMEDHIVADIAYAVWHYWQSTGDDDFIQNYGAEMILECARYWASRVKGPLGDGLYHIDMVIGPDEYHERINDNAYTNLMAQWTMNAGLSIAEWMISRHPKAWQRVCQILMQEYLSPKSNPEKLFEKEMRQWRTISTKMYIDYHPEQFLFEQYHGFFQLEPAHLSNYLEANVPLDMLLGRHAIQASQIVKQADVLMIFLLLGQRYTPYQWVANFYFYEPRTAHGSSLSPGVHALLAAQLEDLPLALNYFRQTATIDLSNHMGNASGGIHIAAMGSLWQALVHGFAGLQVRDQAVLDQKALDQHVLQLAPHLPSIWKKLAFPFQYRGHQLTITIEWEHEAQKPQKIETSQNKIVSIEVQKREQGAAPPESVVHLQLGIQEVITLMPGQSYTARSTPTGTWEAWEYDRPKRQTQPDSGNGAHLSERVNEADGRAIDLPRVKTLSDPTT